MHDPMTVAFDIPSYKVRERWKILPHLVTIWHVDPERDGADDSCDWFGGRRLTEKQRKTLEEITVRFVHEWNRGAPYERFGWFMPTGDVKGIWRDGEPNYSTHAIVLAMFRIAANHHFGHWSRAADKFLRDNVFNILFFAENSCDSICDDIEQKHGTREGSVRNQAERMAGCIYGWILRAERPWYRHPRWHIWHWKVQIHPLQHLRRFMLSRCAGCGKRFKWNESVCGGGWNPPAPRWFEAFRGEREIYHHGCHPSQSHLGSPKTAKTF